MLSFAGSHSGQTPFAMSVSPVPYPQQQHDIELKGNENPRHSGTLLSTRMSHFKDSVNSPASCFN